MDHVSIPNSDEVNKAVEGLKSNGFVVYVVENGEKAKAQALELITEGSEVMTMTSKTLEQIGLTKELNESGKYNSVRTQMNSLDRNTQKKEMSKIGGVHEFAVVSTHAVTQDGKLIWASNSGSQIPALAYGADKVIVIASTKKIVKDLDSGLKRIYEDVLPQENKRVQAAYGMPESNVRELFILNNVSPMLPGRVQVILVNEDLGF
ncbi:MAG: LUD domain-containing protein [Candidatus Dojkabacteria bacterium]